MKRLSTMHGEAYLGGRILVVDDEEANVVLLRRMLVRAGYAHVTVTVDSRAVLPLFQETRPDLILLDLHMPHLDGFEVMEQLAALVPPETYMPILVLTADVTPQALQRALSSGAKDFLTKPFDQTELLLRVKNLLETRFVYAGLQAQLQGLENLYEEAQLAVSIRDESLSTISHDIGQPLAALRLTTESLQHELAEPAPPQGSVLLEELRRIDRAAQQVAAMISELSDLARLQMGHDLVLQHRSVDLVSLLRTVLDESKRLRGQRRLRLETSSDRQVGQWDETRLKRVFSNLISNAIRYSPDRSEITVSLEEVEEGGSRTARVAVRDLGVGIPDADLPRIFDRYYRGRNVSSRVDGTGIGLSSAKQIVEQHGGSIQVESEEGRGTTVTVLLPL